MRKLIRSLVVSLVVALSLFACSIMFLYYSITISWWFMTEVIACTLGISMNIATIHYVIDDIGQLYDDLKASTIEK